MQMEHSSEAQRLAMQEVLRSPGMQEALAKLQSPAMQEAMAKLQSPAMQEAMATAATILSRHVSLLPERYEDRPPLSA